MAFDTIAPVRKVGVNFGYNTGVFNPSVLFGGAAVGVTYGTRWGQYTRLGDRLWFNLQIQFTNIGSSVGDLSLLTALPAALYAQENTNLNYPWLFNVDGSLAGEPISCLVTGGTANISLEKLVTVSLANPVKLTNSDFRNTSILRVSGSWRIE